MNNTSETSNIAKNTLFLNIATITTRVLGFFTSLLLARYLGEMAFGRYAFAMSFAGIFVILTDLGLGYLTVREVARDRSTAGKYLAHILFIRTVLGLATLALVFASAEIMDYAPEIKAAVYVMAFYVIFKCIGGSFNSILMAFEKMGIVAALDIILNSLILVGILVGIWRSQDLMGLIRVYPAAVVTCFCIAFWITVKTCAAPQQDFSASFAGSLVRNSIPFALASVCMVILTNIDMVMLKTIKGDVSAGYYGVTRTLVSAMLFIPANFLTVLYPVFSRLFQSSSDALARYYEHSFRLLAVMALPIAAGGVIVSEKILVLFYGHGYAPAAPALRIMSLALAIQFVTASVTVIMLAGNRQRSVTWVSFLAMLLNFILNMAMIPRYGINGASVSTLISYAFIFVMLYILASKYVCRINIALLIFKPFLAAVGMALFTFAVRQENILLVMGASAAVYAALLLATGEVRRKDVNLFIQMFSGGRQADRT